MEFRKSVHSRSETAKCKLTHMIKGGMSTISHSLLDASEESCKPHSILILFCVWNLSWHCHSAWKQKFPAYSFLLLFLAYSENKLCKITSWVAINKKLSAWRKQKHLHALCFVCSYHISTGKLQQLNHST